MLGRAKASANSTITAARSANSSQWRSRIWRRFVLSRCLMNRSAGNSRCFGCCRISRWSTIGTATASAPPRNATCTNVISTSPAG